MQGIATGRFAMTSASAPGKPQLSASEGVATAPLAEVRAPAGAPPRSPGLPPVSVAVRSIGVGTKAMAVSDAPFGQSEPVDAPGAASNSIEQAAAPTGKEPAVLVDAPELPVRSGQAATADSPKTFAHDGLGLPDQTSQDASTGDGQPAPGQAEPAKYDAAQLQEAPSKEVVYARLATRARPDEQKPGKSGLDATQTETLREIDAPAAAEPTQWAVKDAVNPVSDRPQPQSGAYQDLDLGNSAPAREESMQDAYFRRSEQYQFLSDRVSEALGQRLSAQIAKGVWELNLQLNPRHLGKIDIRLGMRGSGTIDAEFNADQQHTRDLLLNGLPRLKEVMAASGMEMANMEVKHGGTSAQGGHPHARQSLPTTLPGPLPDTQAPVAQAASHTARIGADGLDVMV
jgi:flagellar hook-length control protein FliK